jgi:hypothetical protein
MHILCPHCRSPIELVRLDPRQEIACPSCGSGFRLETKSTTGPPAGAARRLDASCHASPTCVHSALNVPASAPPAPSR